MSLLLPEEIHAVHVPPFTKETVSTGWTQKLWEKVQRRTPGKRARMNRCISVSIISVGVVDRSHLFENIRYKVYVGRNNGVLVREALLIN